MTLQAINSGVALERDRIGRERDSQLNDLRTRYELLSPRERKVLKLASAGLLNKQIGDKMKLSEVTVQIHRRIVMHTLGAKSLPDLVRLADAFEMSRDIFASAAFRPHLKGELMPGPDVKTRADIE